MSHPPSVAVLAPVPDQAPRAPVEPPRGPNANQDEAFARELLRSMNIAQVLREELAGQWVLEDEPGDGEHEPREHWYPAEEAVRT